MEQRRLMGHTFYDGYLGAHLLVGHEEWILMIIVALRAAFSLLLLVARLAGYG